MPFATNPNKKLRVVLPDDVGSKPEPCFYFRYMPYAKCTELSEFWLDVQKADGKKLDKLIGEHYEKLFDRVRENLVGWDNMQTDHS